MIKSVDVGRWPDREQRQPSGVVIVQLGDDSLGYRRRCHPQRRQGCRGVKPDRAVAGGGLHLIVAGIDQDNPFAAAQQPDEIVLGVRGIAIIIEDKAISAGACVAISILDRVYLLLSHGASFPLQWPPPWFCRNGSHVWGRFAFVARLLSACRHHQTTRGHEMKTAFDIAGFEGDGISPRIAAPTPRAARSCFRRGDRRRGSGWLTDR